MIPIIDDMLQAMLLEKLRWLKNHSAIIDHIFVSGRRSTLTSLKKFITTQKIHVIVGYPKEQTLLPAYVIVLAPEQEQPTGLGDDHMTFEDYDLGLTDDDSTYEEKRAIEIMSTYISSAYMNTNYRIECWSDNGDLTTYMYAILKWCIFASRQQMLDFGWVNINSSGMDLELASEYLPIPIFRRALQINFMYENLYYEKLTELSTYEDVIEHPDKYKKDDKGNIIDKYKKDEDGNDIEVDDDDPDKVIVIPYQYTWLLTIHYVFEDTKEEVAVQVYESTEQDTVQVKFVTRLPFTGTDGVVYALKVMRTDGSVTYDRYVWSGVTYTKLNSLDDIPMVLPIKESEG